MSIRRRIGATAIAITTGLTLLAGCSSGSPDTPDPNATDFSDRTLTIWDYESDDSAMGLAWAKAIDIFKDEHPGVTVVTEDQTFEQIQKNAKIILTGDDVPDVMEYNKGNATAGQLASQGLLTPLTDEVEARGWDDIITGGLATTAQYDDRGMMGSGDWYGITNYGEYVTVYYNKDMFAAQGIEVPTTYDEFITALQTFADAGITPLATAGAEYPLMQLWYQLVLAQVDRDWVDAYQLFDGDVDWQSPEMIAATDTLREWVTKGYIAADCAGLVAEDMGTAFIAGTYPIMVSGSWWFGRLQSEISYDWGQFLFPGAKLNIGSSGNLWVVPESAKNKDLAYDFIDATLRPEVQNILGEHGGLPVSGDPSTITDEATKLYTENFLTAVEGDQLAFYPDWPVAGFYDQLVSAFQSVVNDSKSSTDVLTTLGEFYESGKDDILNG
ncbi:MAG: extracellular solute-binding protein [Propionibacteriaceae bacterium]|jgi:raffinose/stachyose/melibiose transport system substrate-binding protein|nr:extracellular solute-binding protein [Propionibacteriaceae bacterium]